VLGSGGLQIGQASDLDYLEQLAWRPLRHPRTGYVVKYSPYWPLRIRYGASIVLEEEGCVSGTTGSFRMESAREQGLVFVDDILVRSAIGINDASTAASTKQVP
jgi:hypothetical protein